MTRHEYHHPPAEKQLLELGTMIFKATGSLPVVVKGTAQWDDWRAWRVNNGLPVVFMDSRGRYSVPTEFPPVNIHATLAEWRGGKKGGLET